MTPRLRPSVPLTALVVLLVVSTAALAQLPGIRDGAGLFKAETVQRADEQIEQIHRRYHVDLIIETIKPLSAEQTKALKERKDAAARNRFFGELAEKRAQETGANGIYVWICKSPAR